MLGEVMVDEGQGLRPATPEERRQLEEKQQLDREEQAAIEDSFNKFQAAQAQAEDREALDHAMNGPQEVRQPKRMRLVYELHTREGTAVARGSHDVLVEPSARLRVTTEVHRQWPGEQCRGRIPAPPRDMPLPVLPGGDAEVCHEAAGAGLGAEGVADSSDMPRSKCMDHDIEGVLGDDEDVADADVGSVEFDEAVLQSSQQVEPPPFDKVVRIPGCPVSLARAYMAHFLDQSITEELIEDRFGPEVLRLFLDSRQAMVAERGPAACDTLLDAGTLDGAPLVAGVEEAALKLLCFGRPWPCCRCGPCGHGGLHSCFHRPGCGCYRRGRRGD